MSFSINPLTFQTDKIDTKKNQTSFLFKLSQLLSQILAQFNKLITSTQLSSIGTDLGAISSNKTVDCTGVVAVCLHIGVGASITLTLSNLTVGSPVTIAAVGTGSFTFKIAGTDPNGNAYTVLGGSGGAQTVLSTTGIAVTTATFFVFTGGSYYTAGGTPVLALNI